MINENFSYLNPISDNYVTGDNIYLRELQNFFFQTLGMMSITHYGAIGDGRTDNYGPLQVAIDDAHRRGISYLYVPYGRYIYTGELINIGDIIFVGNPHAHIINIRTNEEIKIYQFGWDYNNIYTKSEINRFLGLSPEDFYELEYISSTFSQLISTKINSQPNVKVQMKMQFRTLNEFQAVFGNHFTSSTNMSFGADDDNGWFMVVGGNTSYSGNVPQIDTDYEIEFYAGKNEQYLKIGGLEEITDTRTLGDETNAKLWLFGRNSTPPMSSSNIRLYYAKVYVDDVLVRDFVPAQSKYSEEIGLFDKVSKKFFGNIGVGELFGGPIASDIIV